MGNGNRLLGTIAAIILIALLYRGCSTPRTSTAPTSTQASYTKSPTATPKPTSTPQPTPAPVIAAGLGETLHTDILSMTLEEVTRFTPKNKNDAAEDGHEYIVLWFTATNNSAEDDRMNMFSANAYVDNFAVSDEMPTIEIGRDYLWGEIAAGRSKTGFVHYMVPIGWEEIEFQYSPYGMFSDDDMIFIITQDDVKED